MKTREEMLLPMKGMPLQNGQPLKTTTAVKPTHTPTPWKIEYAGDAEKCHPAIIMARPLEIRVSRAEDFGDPLPDAAFIVRAVNSHEALINAIKDALASEETNSVGKFRPTILGDLRTVLENVLSMAGEL